MNHIEPNRRRRHSEPLLWLAILCGVGLLFCAAAYRAVCVKQDSTEPVVLYAN